MKQNQIELTKDVLRKIFEAFLTAREFKESYAKKIVIGDLEKIMEKEAAIIYYNKLIEIYLSFISAEAINKENIQTLLNKAQCDKVEFTKIVEIESNLSELIKCIKLLNAATARVDAYNFIIDLIEE